MTTEEKNFEYKVEFEDGLRPAFAIYGIDHEHREIYGYFAFIGIHVGAGYEVLGTVSFEGRAGVNYRMKGGVEYSVSVRDFRSEISRNVMWEEEFLEGVRNQGMNCIKVQDHAQIEPAVRHHADSYSHQFEELERMSKNLFKEFIREHPGYGYGVVFPENKVL